MNAKDDKLENENKMRYSNKVISGAEVIGSMLLAYFHN
jgi:hypothetical protein